MHLSAISVLFTWFFEFSVMSVGNLSIALLWTFACTLWNISNHFLTFSYLAFDRIKYYIVNFEHSLKAQYKFALKKHSTRNVANEWIYERAGR